MKSAERWSIIADPRYLSRSQQEHNMMATNGGIGMTDEAVKAFIARYRAVRLLRSRLTSRPSQVHARIRALPRGDTEFRRKVEGSRAQADCGTAEGDHRNSALLMELTILPAYSHL